MKFADIVQSADWKTEKHVPVIDAPDICKAGEKITVEVSVGKEIAHPNTTEHHIRWIKLLFKPDNGKFAYDLGMFEFNAHGESTDGANKGPAYTNLRAKRDKVKRFRNAACRRLLQYPRFMGERTENYR